MHEAKHVAAGLDLWYQVTCSDEAAASGQTWSKLEAFLAKDDAIHEGVAYVEPALAVKLSQAPSLRPTTAPTTPGPTTSRPTTLTGVPNDPLFSSQSHYSSIALEAAWWVCVHWLSIDVLKVCSVSSLAGGCFFLLRGMAGGGGFAAAATHVYTRLVVRARDGLKLLDRRIVGHRLRAQRNQVSRGQPRSRY